MEFIDFHLSAWQADTASALLEQLAPPYGMEEVCFLRLAAFSWHDS